MPSSAFGLGICPRRQLLFFLGSPAPSTRSTYHMKMNVPNLLMRNLPIILQYIIILGPSSLYEFLNNRLRHH
jgi:hypothetical protein